LLYKTVLENGMFVLSAFPRELRFGMKYPEAGVKTQFCLAVLTFKSCSGQCRNPNCTLNIQNLS